MTGIMSRNNLDGHGHLRRLVELAREQRVPSAELPRVERGAEHLRHAAAADRLRRVERGEERAPVGAERVGERARCGGERAAARAPLQPRQPRAHVRRQQVAARRRPLRQLDHRRPAALDCNRASCCASNLLSASTTAHHASSTRPLQRTTSG